MSNRFKLSSLGCIFLLLTCFLIFFKGFSQCCWRNQKHKMLHYLCTIYLAQWTLDREDFLIAWFLISLSNHYGCIVWPIILLDVASLTLQGKQSLSSANLPTYVTNMSKTPHVYINQEIRKIIILTWNPFNLPHAYHIPWTWLCKMQHNKNNILSNIRRMKIILIIPKLDVCPWTEVQSSPSQPSQDSWTQDPEVLVLWLFSKQKK